MNVTKFKRLAKNLDPSIAILVSGPHGIGKSQIIEQVINEMGMELVVFMCSQLGDVGDFIGLPKHESYVNRFYKRHRKTGEMIEMSSAEYMSAKSDETYVLTSTMDLIIDGSKVEVGLGEIVTLTKFCPPYWYRKGVDVGLFLDEINRARPEIGNAAMQLTLEKKILDLQLTKGSRIFSAINPSGNAKYGVEEMGPAQLDRWLKIELKPDLQEWLDHAEEKGFHEAVMNYVEANPRNLIPYENEELTKIASKGSENKVPSPRSYEMLSKALKSLEAFDKDYFRKEGGELELSEITSGCVGPGVAMDFAESYYAKSISPEQALKNPDGECKDLIAGYHAGRQKRFMNNVNKYIEELVNAKSISFENNELLTKDESLVEFIKKTQTAYNKLINIVRFEVAASIYNKTFVEAISNTAMWIRILLLEKLKLNGETIELPEGKKLKAKYIENAVEVA